MYCRETFDLFRKSFEPTAGRHDATISSNGLKKKKKEKSNLTCLVRTSLFAKKDPRKCFDDTHCSVIKMIMYSETILTSGALGPRNIIDIRAFVNKNRTRP